MTKARRRNLRAGTVSPAALRRQTQRRPLRSDDDPSDLVQALDAVKDGFDSVHLDPNASRLDQLDLNSFVDMTSHSSDLVSLFARSKPSRASANTTRTQCGRSNTDHDNDDGVLLFYYSQEQQSSAPPAARNVVNFLRNKSGIKTRVGALNGKRVDYFKGSAAVKALLSPAYAKLKDVPKVTSKEEAEQALHNIIPYAFFLRVDRGASTGGKDSPKVVEINPQQMFKSDLHYVWLYEGSQLGLKLAGLAMVVVMLAGVMFPLWPPTMRLGVWYLSVGALGLIGLFFAIAILRLIFWLITLVVAKPGIWIFPNLFEDVGFVDSFIPLWAWDVPPPPKKSKPSTLTATATSAGEKRKKKPSATGPAGTATGARARQQALSNLGGAAPSAPPESPTPPQQAATSTPAHAPQPNGRLHTTSSATSGPGATSDSLDDIN